METNANFTLFNFNLFISKLSNKMINKNKTCLLVMPTNQGQDVSATLKLSTVIEIISHFENEKIDLKIATYRGNKPYLNWGKDPKHRAWAEKNEDILLNVLNIDNISPSKFDAILVPNYLSIYEELKIHDHSLTKLILQFHQANKIICTLGHGTYSLCKCFDLEENNWSFIGYNLSGYSLNNLLREGLFSAVPYIIEEMVMLQGGNFISNDSSNMSDDVLVIADRNVITGLDDNCLQLILQNLSKKIIV